MRTSLMLPDDRNQFFYNKSETSMKIGFSSIYWRENELQTDIIHKGFITLSWVVGLNRLIGTISSYNLNLCNKKRISRISSRTREKLFGNFAWISPQEYRVGTTDKKNEN